MQNGPVNGIVAHVSKVIHLPEEEPVDDGDFRRMTRQSHAMKGGWAEMVVAADCLSRGYHVSIPIVPPQYDLIVDRGTGLVRVQVKIGPTRGNIAGNLAWRSYRWDYTRGSSVKEMRTKYNPDSFDFLAIAVRQSMEVFYVPMEDIDLSKARFYIAEEDKDKYKSF